MSVPSVKHMRGPLRGTADSKNAQGNVCYGSVEKQSKNNRENCINYVSNPWILNTDVNTTYQLLTDHLFPKLSLLLSF